MIAKSHRDAEAVRRAGERAMAESSDALPGLVAAGAIERARVIRELKLDHIRLKSLNQELSAARDQLQKSLHHYRDLYDFAPVGYVVFDATGSIR